MLPAQTGLVRIHRSHFGSRQFNPNPAGDPWQGGRFDSGPPDLYGFLYAASSDVVAVAESLLRQVPSAGSGARFLPRAQLANRSISDIGTTCDLKLVKLHGSGLHAIDQDDGWLVTTDAGDYQKTREWGWRLRLAVPDAQGFVWRSKRYNDGFAYVFFEDRCPDNVFDIAGNPGTMSLDQEPGTTRVRTALNFLHCTVA